MTKYLLPLMLTFLAQTIFAGTMQAYTPRSFGGRIKHSPFAASYTEYSSIDYDESTRTIVAVGYTDDNLLLQDSNQAWFTTLHQHEETNSTA